MTSALRVSGTLAALAFAALLSACSQPAPPPPAPPPPAVSLSPKLIEQAAAYRYYMSHVSAITPDFADGDSIAKAVAVGASYEPKQLQRGATAYAAVVALQDPAFLAGVRTYAVNADQRREVVAAILKDPAYVVAISGSASAAGLVKAALGNEGQQLYDAGKAVKQSAYDIQKQKWSKSDVLNRELRLSQAKTLSATPVVGDLNETARLQQVALGAAPLGLTAEPATPPYSPIVIRGLAVAALAALGEGGDANVDTLMAVMAESNIAFCMNMAKLNLYQCLAVSKPHYEDVFCLGQHIMMDTGRCVIKASGNTEPYEAKFIPKIRVAEGDTGYKVTPAKTPIKAATKKR
ncbi:hypothetical protein [Phenylobacterium sp.]|uniref:hypothetical protein n=1 Tax=Phenylobacterium sp. TaxID=1871053 RepID=UPI00271642D3|nr:hypothetical protein [Phenylobacterium sp.]MDO8380906.1 hypothetical protein [Phenylobacterium sp.]